MFDSTGNFYYGESLYHHGVKGMKWGVRRYQNPDGSLTAKGKKRDSEGKKSDKNSKSSNAKRVAKGAAVVAGLALAGVGLHAARKYQKNLGEEAVRSLRNKSWDDYKYYKARADFHSSNVKYDKWLRGDKDGLKKELTALSIANDKARDNLSRYIDGNFTKSQIRREAKKINKDKINNLKKKVANNVDNIVIDTSDKIYNYQAKRINKQIRRRKK